MDEKLNNDIYRYAIRNAYQHKGKAAQGAIVGKVLALDPELKKEIKSIMPTIAEIVKKVNSLTLEEIESEYKKFEEEGFELKKTVKREGLPELEWPVEENIPVNTRAAPNPDGAIHFGNARQFVLSKEYAKKYNGKFILRFEDSDPKVKKPMPEAADWILEDLAWLDCEPDETYYISDRMDIYYEHMKKLIMLNAAYVCTCPVEEWREKKNNSEACPHRDTTVEKNLEEFEKMKSHEYKQGQAVLVCKTDLNTKDPSVRDWIAARIVDDPDHPRLGKEVKLWPTFNLQNGVDDHLMNVTMIIRGQEHSQNAQKQEYMYNYFGWKFPHAYHTGRIQIGELVLSKTKIREGMEKGEYSSWTDPRLATVRALRRRGFTPQALRKVILDINIRPSDVKVSMENLIAENKKTLENIKSFKTAEIQDATFPIEAQVTMTDNTKQTIFTEEQILLEKDHVRLENFGYCKIDSTDEKNKKLELYFTHS